MSKELDDLIRKAESLSREDRLLLLEHLRRGVSSTGKARRQWREIRGAAPYPLLGEDAQASVSQSRREGDEHRQSQMRNERASPSTP